MSEQGQEASLLPLFADNFQPFFSCIVASKLRLEHDDGLLGEPCNVVRKSLSGRAPAAMRVTAYSGHEFTCIDGWSLRHKKGVK
jgi:hypothetical protein